MATTALLSQESLAALFEAVQECRIASVQFIECPGLHTHAVGQRPIDQVQGDLRFGAEHHVVGDVVFFLRSLSAAHSWDR